jgi:hypothetical protein
VVQLALCMDEGGGCENSEWLGFIVGRVLDMGVEELGASRRERGGGVLVRGGGFGVWEGS